ncbi:NAD(P)-dependent oxidoreductase [Arthrobacter zhaoguopingii]|uniref:NAD(P)-dependent oxidoreductase n=1 Tax=Arthrobacter zhaoguopingii TaxID=2681491 RepID=UPI001356EEAE|nr:NAD(P)H-binding protein [Arthrobacter zhaoguopingii]
MVRITVLGGTGYTGSAVARKAQRRGHEVVAVSRNRPADPLPGVTYTPGSVLDPDFLETVVAGSDVVFESVAPRGEMAGREEGVVERLIALTAGTGIRLGVMGGASSLLVAPDGPRLYDVSTVPEPVRPEVETGIALLEMLKTSPENVDWFYVSPPVTFGVWAPAEEKGSYRLSDDVLLADAEGKSTISAADLALAVLDEIEEPRYRRRRFHAAH